MRIKLILAFAIVVIVSVGGVVIVAQQSTEQAIHAVMGDSETIESNTLLKELANYYQENQSWDGVQNSFLYPQGASNQGKGNKTRNSIQFQLINSSGVVVIDTTKNSLGTKVRIENIEPIIPVIIDDQIVGYLHIEGNQYGYSYRKQGQQLASKLKKAGLTAGLIAGGIALLLALLFTYQLVKPIRELTNAAKKLGDGDLTQRVELHGNDELATLGKTFNLMADSLQQAQESRKAMTADIAHELRTPLAIQRANLEAIQDGLYSPSKENLNIILEQNLLLSRLVDDLRTLAIADAGQLSLTLSKVDLNSFISRILERFKAKANSKNVGLEFRPGQIPKLNIDIGRVEQILNNLLSNAVRYTQEGGLIRIKTSTEENFVLIEIRDSGPGIPQEDLPLIFKRFYRVNKSRNREDGGTGLGLAIAKKLAEAHGGDLIASNHPKGGALFTLKLPI